MSADKLPKGLWPVMLSTFTKNNEVDTNALKTLTQMYIDAGSNGLFANCLSSEMYQLTEKERLLITQTVVEQASGKVPVVATGSFSANAGDNIEFIKKIYDCGVNAVILISSILADPTQDDGYLKKQLELILEGTGNIPLGVYECPVPYKRLLSPAMMEWMASTGRFVYHKDTCCNSPSIDKKVKALGNSIFGLYNADTATSLDSLDSGAMGISPISANFYPEPYRHLLDLYFAEGRTKSVEKLHAILTMMDRVTHMFYPYAAKVFLQRRGLPIETTTRIPYEAFGNVDQIRMDALYTSFEMVCELYGIQSVI
jgi:4-hydroxy-tetrahydrodipicolinate synthase